MRITGIGYHSLTPHWRTAAIELDFMAIRTAIQLEDPEAMRILTNAMIWVAVKKVGLSFNTFSLLTLTFFRWQTWRFDGESQIYVGLKT